MSCVQRNASSRPRSGSDGHRLQADRKKAASLTMSQTRRRRFYIFVHVLLARLEREDVDGLDRAKEVIRECTQRHKDGDPRYERLVDVVHMELRQTLGSKVIRETERCLTHELHIAPTSSRTA
uniref:Uncharacterized protein n=1 Tax=Minutocellus polymorphus TaxID=265543 RepID=A0A7S0FJH8_9STRA